MSNIYDPRFDPIPANPVEHPHRLAYDLAWGIHHRKWRNAFYIYPEWYEDWRFDIDVEHQRDAELINYVSKVWGENLPNLERLADYNYFSQLRAEGGGVALFQLTERALRLPEEKLSASIFISYARKYSSALVLLLNARFMEYGRVPYFDLNPVYQVEGSQLILGDNWHGSLEDQIKNRENFIVLIAPGTLHSEYVCKEIRWAIQYRKQIISILHNGFDINNPDHTPDDLPDEIRNVIKEKHREQVSEETPKQYDATIRTVLNQFGIPI